MATLSPHHMLIQQVNLKTVWIIHNSN